MSVTSLLRWVVAPRVAESRYHYECGSCGATLTGPRDACAYCPDSRIVTFEIGP